MNARARITAFASLATLLGSLSLLPIYQTYGWLPRVVLIIATVGVISWLANRVRALVVVAPVLMVAGVTMMVTLLYAHAVAPLGFLPGPAALRVLHSTLSNGFSDTTQLSAPVAITRGLSLMTTGGIGLVAVVVETMATGLRRPAVAGLPLLAIFTVPAAILSNGVGWQPFVFGAAGYLALLLAEGRDRITGWGRPVRASRNRGAGPTAAAPGPARPSLADGGTPFGSGGGDLGGSGRAPVATNQLTQVGRRVGAAAIGVAVVVPVIIPGLHSGWFGTHHTSGIGGIGDDGSGTSIDPIVSLRRDLDNTTPIPLFSYTTTGTPAYLRMLTLDKFDGTEWSPAQTTSQDDVDATKQLPRPAGVTAKPSKSVTTEITVAQLKEPYLPVPMVPTVVKAKGRWLYNPVTSVVYSEHNSTVRLKYEVTNAVYAPAESVLNSVVNDPSSPTVNKYLSIPAHLPATLQEQADSVVALAHATTAYQKAVALQDWFQTNFLYDLDAKSGSNVNALVSFLRDRTGYCEQFAATMALMARMEGIPSRVDVGFTPGSREPGTNTYMVTSADAHAWPELYFTGVGWLRFEPTPRADGQTSEPGYTTASGLTNAQGVGPTELATMDPAGPNIPTPTVDGAHQLPGVPRATASDSTGLHLPIGWLVVLFLLLLAGLSAPAVRALSRRRRWAAAADPIGRAHAAWHELADDMRDLDLDWRGGVDTPRRAAAALIATRRLQYRPDAEQALLRLARAEELARYAIRASSRIGDCDPRADELVVRQALFESVPKPRRVRARLVPPSTGPFFGELASDAVEAVRMSFRRATDAALAKMPAR